MWRSSPWWRATAIEPPAQRHRLDGTELRLGASIGIARYPDDGNGPAELVRAADHAMYRAKAGGRGTYRYASQCAP
ncbi:diguanylate cyclase domain-containing protein [Alkalilimnicola ehrlichii]|uniref:diguanylate cyclase domain-containing protein n=1 Tax=Alkalilimnicola ehrlichii TaxID=351052 RepID=UPI003B9F25BD